MKCHPERSRKIISRIAQKLFLIAAIVIAVTSCTPKKEADWTILIYMAADNGLNDAAMEDIDEMLAADFSDDIKVIVQIDESEYAENSSAKRYRIRSGSKSQISNLGEIDSGDPATLTQFANWGFDKYPSDKKALVIWSHGNGWYPKNRDLPPSFCPDEESGNFISIADKEFKNAIKNINGNLDILILDACNMQTMEVIAEIYDYTDYIIASEDAVCDDGYPYHTILTHWEDHAEVKHLAENIAFDFHYYYWFEGIYPISCSVVETSMFSPLLVDLSDFTQIWADSANNEIFLTSREQCIEFNGSFVSIPADVDIKEFFSLVLENDPPDSLVLMCNTIIEDIDNCFIFQKTEIYPTGYTTDKVGSAIIWFPDEETSFYFEDRKDEYLQLDFAETGWPQFLQNTFTN